MIIVEGIDRAINQMKNYGMQTIQKVSNQIQIYGDRIVQELQIDYPDLMITSNWFPQKMEYWITIQRLGEEITWIWCERWHLYYKIEKDHIPHTKPKTWSADPKQEFTSVSTGKKLDIDKLVQRIADELSLQINQVVGRKV